MINEAMMSPAPSAPSRPFLGAPVSDPRGNDLALLQVLKNGEFTIWMV